MNQLLLRPPPLTRDTKIWAAFENIQEKAIGATSVKMRVLTMLVRKDNYEFTYRKEIGLASLWPRTAMALHIPSFDCYSAGEIEEIAQQKREAQVYQDRPPTDLMAGYHQTREMRWKKQKHSSTSGRFITIQR